MDDGLARAREVRAQQEAEIQRGSLGIRTDLPLKTWVFAGEMMLIEVALAILLWDRSRLFSLVLCIRAALNALLVLWPIPSQTKGKDGTS
jgi:hypothetical protein